MEIYSQNVFVHAGDIKIMSEEESGDSEKKEEKKKKINDSMKSLMDDFMETMRLSNKHIENLISIQDAKHKALEKRLDALDA